jgi:hypothetical protein
MKSCGNGEVNLLLKGFQTVERVRRIWQNTLKPSYTKLMIYYRRNSKPIVGIGSHHRHTSFSCRAYFDSDYIYVHLRESVWSSLRENDHKQQLVQSFHKWSQSGATTSLTLEKLTVRTSSRCRRNCFENRAMQQRESV